MGRTFSIIKPDATKRNLTGAINAMIEGAGLRIVAQKRVHMTQTQAERFYAVHAERPFFGELVEFMMSEPVVVQVLDGENAVARYREVMGATNPAEADEGTIRKLEDEHRVVFRYAEGTNPNGSINDIAGIINEKGNVLGMLPHPENLVEPLHGGLDGRGIFESLLETVA